MTLEEAFFWFWLVPMAAFVGVVLLCAGIAMLVERRRQARLYAAMWQDLVSTSTEFRQFQQTVMAICQRCRVEMDSLHADGIPVPSDLNDRLDVAEQLLRKYAQPAIWEAARNPSSVAQSNTDHQSRRLRRRRRRAESPAPADIRPPRLAEYLLYFLPKKEREPLHGDLTEVYPVIWRKFGPRRAWLWYNTQVLRSFWPLISRAVTKLIKLKALSIAADIIRRVIS